jgi:hypothetical protein
MTATNSLKRRRMIYDTKLEPQHLLDLHLLTQHQEVDHRCQSSHR